MVEGEDAAGVRLLADSIADTVRRVAQPVAG
jgi:hypothetical protein